MVYPRPALTVMRSQLRLRLERRTRTLGEPCLDLSPAKDGDGDWLEDCSQQ